jgi:hypothetical protein
MKNIKYVLLGILVLGILGAIFKPKTKSVETEKSIVVTKKTEPQKLAIDLDRSEFWDEFDPMVKERVYKMIDEKDCTGLQQEFNTTADVMDKLQATGKSASRNLDLMDFLEEQMKKLDCHK